MVVGSITAAPARVEAQGLSLIRDSEIEALLNDYARPIFKAAGVNSGRIHMRIVRSDAFNAFVVDNQNVFVHTGMLMQSDTPNQVIGVIAHETGHIANRHMAALRERIQKDRTRALLLQILAAGLMGAGVGTGNKDLTGLGGSGLSTGPGMVMRSLLAERRSQESSADLAGMRYLNATKQSGRGMLETFERFKQQEYVGARHQDPFVRSHPVATDRLNQLRRLVERSPHYNKIDSNELQLRHDLMRAKLSGYLESPATVLNRYPRTDNSLPARYARAIARYFQGGHGGLEAALAQIDQLIAMRPGNPYFWEVKGDMLMRSGKSKQAIGFLRKAIKLSPVRAPLMQVQLATALQNSGKGGLRESVKLLKDSLRTDENPRAYRLLATAYYNGGDRPKADAMTAQAYFLEGNIGQAQIFAKRAYRALKAGTPEWLKNEDILKYQPRS
ncbi:MAG: M48 family metalloprotease [Alphaproteobacteria bacterium]|nr:M48 family metalloprotease [Alphaproteobacteria bacterium]